MKLQFGLMIVTLLKVTRGSVLPIALFAVAANQCASATASITIVSTSVGGQPANGASYVNFDALALGVAGGFAANTTATGGIWVALTADAAVVKGSLGGKYAAPYLSNTNGFLFGDSTMSGPDSTKYLTSGKVGVPSTGAAVTMTFAAPQKYFGLLWGSVDNYNILSFYDSADVLIGSITGANVFDSPVGNQGISGTVYVNINSTTDAFSKVVATSMEYAFEFDNVAYARNIVGPGGSIVPEPTSVAIWSAIALGGLGLASRRRVNRRRWSDSQRQAIRELVTKA